MDPGADETDSVILRAKLLYFNAIVNLQCQERCLFAPSLTGFSFNPHCKINYDNRLDRSYPRILSQFVFQGLGFQASHLDILALPVCSSCYNFSLQVVHNGEEKVRGRPKKRKFHEVRKGHEGHEEMDHEDHEDHEGHEDQKEKKEHREEQVESEQYLVDS